MMGLLEAIYLQQLLGDIYLQQHGPNYQINHYVEDGGGHWTPLGHPPIHLKRVAIASPGPWDHIMTFPKPLQDTLQVLYNPISSQDFYVPRSV